MSETDCASALPPPPWGSPSPSPWGSPTAQYGYHPGWTPEPEKGGALSIIAFIASVIAFVVGWVPFLGVILGAVALILSLFGVRGPRLRGLSVAGIILSSLAVVASLMSSLLFLLSLSGGSSNGSSSESSQRYAAEDFREVDARTLAGITKDPEAHVGTTIVVYGHVAQFDTNTGPCSLLVHISAEEESRWSDYEHTAMASAGSRSGSCPMLEDVVEDDEVKMSVVVDGIESYTTRIGGSNTVPTFTIVAIEVL